MANSEQLAVLKQGVAVWNQWRQDNSSTDVDLKEADLSKVNLVGVDLSSGVFCGTDLSGADLSWADLSSADLSGARLEKANLGWAVLNNAQLPYAILTDADLSAACLIEANLHHAMLRGANMSWANLIRADLSSADLQQANLVEADLTDAVMNDCGVYGVSAWNVKMEGAQQSNLVMTHSDEPIVTVDNLEIAQFVYLLLNNAKIRDVIDTIGKKGVLILGRFTPERKEVLDAIRHRLRELNFVPIMFDFEGAKTRDFTETVKTLVGMSRFIIADITMPKSSPLELQATVPDYMIPFVPIIWEGEEPFSMFSNLQNKYDWVLDVLEYKNSEQLISVIEKAVIEPALRMEQQLIPRKAEATRKRHAEDYLGKID